MLLFNNTTRSLLYNKWADVRQIFDGLSGIVTYDLQMAMDPGAVFIFLNCRQTHIILLQWYGDGFGVYYIRLVY